MTKLKVVLIISVIIIFLGIGIFIYFNINSLNKYTKIKISEEEVFDRYVNEVIEIIKSDEYDKLDLILNREDGKYRSLLYENIKDEIYSMNILGKNLEIVKYEKIDKFTWNNIYKYTLKNESNEEIILVIKESTPNIYYIEFEK